jgi:hypothetical protein
MVAFYEILKINGTAQEIKGKGLGISRNRGEVIRGDKYEIIQKEKYYREMAKRGTCL